MQTGQNTCNAGNGFNTLAQLRTAPSIPYMGKPPQIVNGKGTEIGKTKAMKGRAKRKMITQKRSLKLVDVAKRKKNDKIKQQFWNSWHCQSKLTSAGGWLHGRYCKNRQCVLCCSIRKAWLMNTYGPIIDKWEDPHLVILTIRAVPAKKLKWLIDAMYRAIHRINDKYQKRRQRGDKIKFMGVRTLECEFKPSAQTYNPHFNILVPNKEVGELLRVEWSKLWEPKYVNAKIQYCERVYSKAAAVNEIMKYAAKVFSEPDIDKKLQNKATAKIYAAAYYNIVNAMKKHRIFERFGFNLPKQTANKPKGGTTKVVRHYIKWKYYPKYFDWVGEDTDGLLTNYSPPPDLLYILDYCIDVLLE